MSASPNWLRRPARRARLRVEQLEDRAVPASNAVVAENQLAGTPQGTWGVSGAGDSTIQGFPTDISVDHGQTISFKINDTANKPYHIDIYRMGYYQGNGARLVATIPSAQVVQKVQPSPLTDPNTGLVDAGNWSVTASWAVPATAVSGLYFARATRDDTGGAFPIYFVVRDDEGGSDLLFQTSDTTWQAYNTWGGWSLYQHTGAPATVTANSVSDAGRAVKVSYNRPLTIDGVAGGYGTYNSPLHGEYPMIRWLEANGYNVSYASDVDTDRHGTAAISAHKVFMSVGHDEYWSGGQRNNVEAARDAGVNLAFFSGNESFWKTRWENSVDGSGTPYRTLVCYKESKDGVESDPLDISSNVWTGTWRDDRFSPPDDGGRPENAMSGTLYMNDRTSTDLGIPLTVGDQDGKLRFWRSTAVANLAAGQTATLGQYIVGYETDEDVDNGFRPAGLMDMSSTTFTTSEHVIVPWGTQEGPGTSTHKLTLYRAASGALVFAAGTVQWQWGLDGTHNDTSTTPNASMQQATVNLFADMGVQPASLQSGLTAATASTDHTAPTAAISSPAAGAVVQAGSPTTVSGTAADAGGGVVAGVEVSTDGGATWHPATGRGSWSYTWTPQSAGTAVIKARAVDDSGNLGAATAGVGVTVSTSNTLAAAYSFDEGSGTTAGDVSGKGNTGTLSNAAWTAAGKFGNALSFNGTNSWVTVAGSSSLNLTGSMTLEAWVKPVSLSGWDCVVLKETANGLAYALYANDNVPRPAGYVHIGTADQEAPGAAGLPLNTWSHLALTYDGAALKMYVNAALVGSLSLTGNVATSSNALRIGGDSVWGEYFNGLIDEVRVYSRALPASEIATDMNTRVNSDTQPPTAPATLTATGSVSSVSLSWSAATDNVGVAHYNVYRSTTPGFTPGAGNLIGQTAATSYTDTGLAPGTYYYLVAAVDGASNVGPASPQAAGVVTGDVTPPTVSVTGPAGGSTVSGIVTVSANASDDVGVVGVQFQVSGANLGAEDTTSPYSVSWNTTGLANGSYTLTAVARDAAGHTTTSAPVTVTVSNVGDAVPPAVSVTAPTGGSTVSYSVTVSADASDNVGVVGVQFLLDGVNLGAELTATPYSVTWNTVSASNGTHTLTARARDAGGNTTTSAGVTVTVSNVSGLVGAWGFEEGSGTSTADASGHGLTGTLSNAAWSTAGKFGKAVSFNGSNAWVTVADNALLHLTSGMTVEAWVRPAAASTDWSAAVIKERAGGLAYALYATDGAGKPPAGYIDKSKIDYNATGASVLPLNTWTHLAVTYDGSTIRLYVNGAQAATKAVSGSIISSTAALRFGGDSVWGEYFNGLIDEVRIYNVALTAAQITTDMNTPVGSPQLAAEGAAGGSAPILTQAELAPVAAEATRRWLATGLTPEQADALSRVQFQIADLGPAGDLALTPVGGPLVMLDDDGAGRGWFVDPAPGGDAEFAVRVDGGGLRAAGGPAAAAYDLLTVVMHELGHVIGLGDHDAGPADLMAAALPLGTRRNPDPTVSLAAVVAPPLPASPDEFTPVPVAPAPAAPPTVQIKAAGSRPTAVTAAVAQPATPGVAAQSLLGADRAASQPQPADPGAVSVRAPVVLAADDRPFPAVPAQPPAPITARWPVSVAWGGEPLFRPDGAGTDLWWEADPAVV